MVFDMPLHQIIRADPIAYTYSSVDLKCSVSEAPEKSVLVLSLPWMVEKDESFKKEMAMLRGTYGKWRNGKIYTLAVKETISQ